MFGKKYKIVALPLAFSVLYYVYYKLSYSLIHEYIFPFRSKDYLESVVNPSIYSLLISVSMAGLSIYLFNKFEFRKYFHQVKRQIIFVYHYKSKKEKILMLLKNKYFLITLSIFIGLFLMYDGYNTYVDNYNFTQLEKIKVIFDKMPKNTYNIRTLVDFNEKFNQNIEPIKNCYYVSTYNGKYPYIVGFKLESWLYKWKYGSDNYVYPKYDIPIDNLCFGLYIPGSNPGDEGGCYDRNFEDFEHTITESCEGSIGGYVYRDLNQNGKKDTGEKGVEGIGLLLGGSVIETDKDGYYSFGNLREGGYDIRAQYLREYYVISPKTTNKQYNIELKKGDILKDINFGVE